MSARDGETMRRVGRVLATFVLGDVVGSTRAWAESREQTAESIGRLGELIDDAVAAHAGTRPIEQGEGDSFVAVFARVSDALGFAIDVQRAAPLPLRVAMHTGEAEHGDDGRWLGPPLNRCARLRALASGGQTLISAATAELAIDNLPPGASLRDLGRHRLRDLSAAEHVRQLCHPDLEDDFPPLASLNRLPNNLPIELSSFIGRDTEIAELVRYLGASQLITLTGAGGSGKTRLAVEVAARVVDEWPDGVWVADLGSTADPLLVPNAVAAAMSVAEQPLQALVDTIGASIGVGRTLLILDNCEHLLDASATLARALLQRCPSVAVLATSREPLGVDGEITYRVPSLALPDRDDDVTSESVRLFVERATAVRPTFSLDEHSTSAVIELCRRLDGLPLAIELAATRCRAMAPTEIAAQLSQHLRILSAGRRSALPRQRTLEASLQWSYDLLTADEQAVLRRLAVFAGGFTLAGAEAVAAGDDVDSWQIVDLLTSLVDKSLVHLDEIDGVSRYRLLETIRVYTAERLAESGELDAARDRHLDYMVAVAESSGLDEYGPVAAHRLVELEIDDLRAARDWGIDTGNGATVSRLLVSTATYWEQWLTLELARIGPTVLRLEGATVEDRVRLLMEVAWATTFTGDVEGGERLAREAAHLAQASNDDRLIGIATYTQGHVDIAHGKAEALEHFDRAIDCFRRCGDRVFLANALQDTAVPLLAAGRTADALARIDESLRVASVADDSSFFALVHSARCLVLPLLGRFEEAMQSAAIVRRSSLRTPFGDCLADAAEAWARSGAGDHVHAVAMARQAVDEAKRFSVLMAIGAVGLVAAVVEWRAGEILEECLLDEVEQACLMSGLPYGAVEIRWLRAERARAAGDHESSAAHAADAVVLADSTPFAALYRPLSRLAAARAALDAGELSTADELAHEALAGNVASELRLLVPPSLEMLAHIACLLESHDEGARLIGAAQAMRQSLGWCPGRPEAKELSSLLERLRTELGEDACAAALAEGAALPEERIVAYVTRGRGERKRPSTGWESLTPTEREVVALVVEGLHNKEVAAKLFISPATVRTHLTHVFAKLGLSGRTELMAAAARRGR